MIGHADEADARPRPAKATVPVAVRRRRRRTITLAIFAVVFATLSVIFMPQVLEELSHRTLKEGINYTRVPAIYPAMAILGVIVGAGFGISVLTLFQKVAGSWEDMATGQKIDLFLGFFAGIIASLPFLMVAQALGPVSAGIVWVILFIAFSAVSILALRSLGDALPWHAKNVAPRRVGIKILDTNVLIDGRLYDIVRAGFLQGEMYIPKFVLGELQHIADSSDALRRQRGRRGLEILRHMQNDFSIEVGTYDEYAGEEKDEVDDRLVTLAKALGGDLVSNDYNLNKVASVQEVKVLNINDLALALRPNLLPGENLELSLIKEGTQRDQAVGYLEDGTMVVVENGAGHIGETHEVCVTQVIQTERGKMIFAALE